MKTQTCTLERFRKDTANHSMEVLQDNGLYRHLKFSNNGSSCYRFDLITWPGYLCICGDMHTYVFQRVQDMFTFFRSDNGEDINPGYWGEKLEAEESQSRARWGKEWSLDTFTDSVKRYLNNYLEDDDGDEDSPSSQEIRAEAESELELIGDEFEAVTFIRDFECGNFRFEDWEGDDTSYTFHYLWCCYAIVWGIQQYDALPKKEPKPKALQQLQEINELAYQINTSNTANVFVWYSGHTGSLDVRANPVTTQYNGEEKKRLFDVATYAHCEFQESHVLEAEMTGIIDNLKAIQGKESSTC